MSSRGRARRSKVVIPHPPHTVPCTLPKALPPPSPLQMRTIYRQGDRGGWRVGGPQVRLYRGGERNLQWCLLRNPHKLRLGKRPHSQAAVLLIPSSKITPWKEEEVILRQLNLSGKKSSEQPPVEARRSPVWLRKQWAHRQGKACQIYKCVSEKPWQLTREWKYSDGIFTWNEGSHRNPLVKNHKIIIWPSV